ncbi:helix-turn-helix transcriptional regulator [Kutzneria chonburiensis]|uniref:LuxR C-terminal-related transcriptional regulator n=1 Tax=Kutzneria chonburiensis TaxID=1483604 RepID=A0ABV6MQ96_9PSEU|nr:LuxR C-terminal-related transcriptional regulator [Kutzneria chonburiensis]
MGRQAEIGAASSLLSQHRLVTMIGPGGAGKTRLAVRIATHSADSFADGVHLVALDSLADPGLLAELVAAEIGMRDAPADSFHQVATFLQDKSLLLVLDNCEHMVEACGMLIGKVLAAAPHVRILATSRHVLGIEGEHLLHVPPLEESDAVRLFVDRASAVVPGFAVKPTNGDTIGRICRQLDGLPLAIELAAAWTRVLSMNELLAQLDNRFDLLSRGGAFRPSRQQTLAATVDWSYTLCSPEEQLLWARLSVFKDGFSLTSAESVCAGGPIRRGDVLMAIAGLVDKSVLVREGYNGSARYWMLETIRRYGHDRLAESGQTEEFRARHNSHFLEFARGIAADWFTGRQLEYLALTRREHANLRSALEYGVGSDALTGPWLAVSLHFFWLNCGFVGEGRRWLTQILERDDLPAELRVQALWVTAYATAVLGGHAKAMEIGAEAVALARSLGDDELLSLASYGEGVAALIGADYPRADARLEEAIACYHRVENPGGRLYPPYAARAMIAALTGDPERSIALADKAIEFSGQRGELWARGYAHYALTMAKWLQGDLDTAFRNAAECVRCCLSFNETSLFTVLAETLAGIALGAGEHARAARILGMVERTSLLVGAESALGDSPVWLGAHHAGIAELRRRMGDKPFEAAFEAGRAIGSLSEAGPFLLEGLTPSLGPLTRREMDVAVLLADGLTNKQIGARLSISPRTVGAHVDHILSKLGFTSRVQIGVWITSRGTS